MLTILKKLILKKPKVIEVDPMDVRIERLEQLKNFNHVSVMKPVVEVISINTSFISFEDLIRFIFMLSLDYTSGDAVRVSLYGIASQSVRAHTFLLGEEQDLSRFKPKLNQFIKESIVLCNKIKKGAPHKSKIEQSNISNISARVVTEIDNLLELLETIT